MKNYALFSQAGRFIGFTNFEPTNGLYKEMPSTFDPTIYVYVGDYENGHLKNVNDLNIKDYREANVEKKWIVFESELNHEAELKITEDLKYPLFKQLNIIMEVLEKNKDKISLTPEFTKMYEDIQEVRLNTQASFESYMQAPKATVVPKENERFFFEIYNQQHLNVNDEPYDVELQG